MTDERSEAPPKTRASTKNRDPNWTTPPEVARLIPGATTARVSAWARNGLIPGAIRLPSAGGAHHRWQLPWTGLIEFLGFDPREISQ